ncbi:MAG: YciI family protein [Pseudomonadota bacterium]
MPQFAFVYIGGDHPSSPEEGQKHFAKYQEWLGSLGEAAISPMNPLKDSQTISPSGDVTEGSSVGMSGYTIVEAGSLDAAVEMAKACPFLEINGTLEVSEIIQMPG